jgi:hypothetical protein
MSLSRIAGRYQIGILSPIPSSKRLQLRLNHHWMHFCFLSIAVDDFFAFLTKINDSFSKKHLYRTATCANKTGRQQNSLPMHQRSGANASMPSANKIIWEPVQFKVTFSILWQQLLQANCTSSSRNTGAFLVRLRLRPSLEMSREYLQDRLIWGMLAQSGPKSGKGEM